jgi:cyclopropane fatty-acyl-phospholipid synthase-like methyltransferase
MTSGRTSWDRIFAERGKVFEEPHEDMPAILRQMKKHKASTILDLGCGSGRHVIYFAQHGFSVYGLDNSPHGLDITNRWLQNEGLTADLRLHDMTAGLPYPDAFFHAVISVQVIHHARIATIRAIIKEIERVLKPGGFLFVTVPAHRDQSLDYAEIEPGTYAPLNGFEKGLAHHFFSPAELRAVFDAFEISDIQLDSTDHYCLTAVKRKS